VGELTPFPTDWQQALVIVAHPDDVEWGAAAAVAAWTDEGKQVAYLLVTRGEAGIAGLAPAETGPLREAEELASAGMVGVSDVTFLDHPDGRVLEGLSLRRDLAAAIRRVRPDLVVTLNPYDRWGSGPGAGWNSADHRAVGRAALDAVGDAGNEWIFPDLGGQVWSTRMVAVSGSPQPTHAVDVDGQHERAVASLSSHRAYLTALDPATEPEVAARRLVEQSLGTPARVAFELL